jgi:hypothetical protein
MTGLPDFKLLRSIMERETGILPMVLVINTTGKYIIVHSVNVYYNSGPVLSPADTALKETDRKPCPF